jgi:hypothetical protein
MRSGRENEREGGDEMIEMEARGLREINGSPQGILDETGGDPAALTVLLICTGVKLDPVQMASHLYRVISTPVQMWG